MQLTPEQETERLLVMRQATTGKIEEIRDAETGWQISYTGHGLFMSKEYGVEPKAGQQIRVYTVQGSLVRGIDLDGEPVYFKSAAELEVEAEERTRKYEEDLQRKFEESREELDATVASLPEPFQRRIQWFRDHNPKFRWEWEAYELSSCVDAVKIAAVATERAESQQPHEWISQFRDLSSEKQRKVVPDLAYDDHSGNTFGAAVMFALHYVIDPEWVFYDHGVGVPLAGCEDYGCHHPRPGVDEFVARHRENNDKET